MCLKNHFFRFFFFLARRRLHAEKSENRKLNRIFFSSLFSSFGQVNAGSKFRFAADTARCVKCQRFVLSHKYAQIFAFLVLTKKKYRRKQLFFFSASANRLLIARLLPPPPSPPPKIANWYYCCYWSIGNLWLFSFRCAYYRSVWSVVILDTRRTQSRQIKCDRTLARHSHQRGHSHLPLSWFSIDKNLHIEKHAFHRNILNLMFLRLEMMSTSPAFYGRWYDGLCGKFLAILGKMLCARLESLICLFWFSNQLIRRNVLTKFQVRNPIERSETNNQISCWSTPECSTTASTAAKTHNIVSSNVYANTFWMLFIILTGRKSQPIDLFTYILDN